MSSKLAPDRVATRRAPRYPRRKRYSHEGASLGLPQLSPHALIRELPSRVSFRALESLSRESGMSIPEIAFVIAVPERTLARRKVKGRFPLEEAERLLRLSRVFESAVALFEGDVAAAMTWLRAPERALDNHTPLDYVRTELGAREVENLIGKLEHGVVV